MPDPSLIIVVIDASGSMCEHGKALLARNLVAYVREHGRVGVETWPPGEAVVVLWGAETSLLDVAPEHDLPSFPASGRARVEPLLAVLDGLVRADVAPRILLLSDGHIGGSEITAFRAWRRRHARVSVRALAVGPDAVGATLEKVADPDGVFLPEEIGAAMATWSLPSRPELPGRVGEIVERSEGAHA